MSGLHIRTPRRRYGPRLLLGALLCSIGWPAAATGDGAAPRELPAPRPPGWCESLDVQAFHAINLKPGHRDALDPFFQGVMPLGDRSAIAVPIALYLGGRVSGDQKLRQVGIYTAAAIASSALATEALKGLVARDRPVQHLGDDHVRVIGQRVADGQSFPSGHASNAFAWATVLADLYPKQAGICFGLATAVAVGRVRVGAHYPSDVLAGAVIGYAAGRLVLSYRDLLLRREEPAPGLNALGVVHQIRY